MQFLDSLVTWLHVTLCAAATTLVLPYQWHEASDLHGQIISPRAGTAACTVTSTRPPPVWFSAAHPQQTGVGWVRELTPRTMQGLPHAPCMHGRDGGSGST